MSSSFADNLSIDKKGATPISDKIDSKGKFNLLVSRNSTATHSYYQPSYGKRSHIIMQETGGSPYNSNFSDSNQSYARKRDLKDQVYQSKRYSPF